MIAYMKSELNTIFRKKSILSSKNMHVGQKNARTVKKLIFKIMSSMNVLCVIVLIPICSFGQAAITGRVFSKSTAKPIANAAVANHDLFKAFILLLQTNDVAPDRPDAVKSRKMNCCNNGPKATDTRATASPVRFALASSLPVPELHDRALPVLSARFQTRIAPNSLTMTL